MSWGEWGPHAGAPRAPRLGVRSLCYRWDSGRLAVGTRREAPAFPTPACQGVGPRWQGKEGWWPEKAVQGPLAQRVDGVSTRSPTTPAPSQGAARGRRLGGCVARPVLSRSEAGASLTRVAGILTPLSSSTHPCPPRPRPDAGGTQEGEAARRPRAQLGGAEW